MSSLTPFLYDPFIEFDRLFDDAFNSRLWPSAAALDASRRARSQQADTFHPRLDLHESKDSDVVTATFELPGLKPEDVAIDVHHNRLMVSGESAASESREEGGYAVRERRFGKFSRSLQLPMGTKPEDIKAKMENGVLTVTFPKAAADQQPQRITIQ